MFPYSWSQVLIDETMIKFALVIKSVDNRDFRDSAGDIQLVTKLIYLYLSISLGMIILEAVTLVSSKE